MYVYWIAGSGSSEPAEGPLLSEDPSTQLMECPVDGSDLHGIEAKILGRKEAKPNIDWLCFILGVIFLKLFISKQVPKGRLLHKYVNKNNNGLKFGYSSHF